MTTHAVSRIAFVLMITACAEAEPGRRDDTRSSQPESGSHPPEEPQLPPVAAGTEDCEQCIHNEFGQCRYERRSYCPRGPKGTDSACLYLVPCAETCCDRFPIEGGLALVRPGRSLRANEYESDVEIARVPASSRGLLVRVTYIDNNQDGDNIQDDEIVVATIGLHPPRACEGVVDDLDGVRLEARVNLQDLQAAPEACSEAVHALGEPDNPGPGIDYESGYYVFSFDSGRFYGERVIKAWTSLEYPGLGYGSAGEILKHIVLAASEPMEREGDVLCYRLPGIMRPRVCSEPEAVHNAPGATP